MVTRYNVNFSEQMIEPSPHGRWVKYEDIALIEASVATTVEAQVAKEVEKEREELASARQKIETSAAINASLTAELQDFQRDYSAVIERQRFLLKTARDRLKLLGHAPNCESRYGQISVGGAQTVGACDCGLDEWFRETGVSHA